MPGAERAETREGRGVERQTATYRSRIFWSIFGAVALASLPGLLLATTPRAIWLTLGVFLVSVVLAYWLAEVLVSPAIALRRRLELKNYGAVDDEAPAGTDDDADSAFDMVTALARFTQTREVDVNQRLPSELAEIERLARAGRVAQMAMQSVRKDLFRHLSHQLKTPLAIVRAHSAAVRAAAAVGDIDTVNDELDQQGEACLRMSKLVEQMLSMAWVEGLEEKGLSGQRANVSQLLMETTRYRSSLFSAKGIDLQMDVEAGLWIQGDRNLLQEMVAALVDNAIKYGPSEASITIRAKRVPGTKSMAIIVADAGPGIPVAERERVFEPFYGGMGTDATGRAVFGSRQHRSMSGAEKSHGLGLSLVHAIAKLHGGTVALEDQPIGPGLVVRILLPISSAPRAA